jgi:hypothetical protein
MNSDVPTGKRFSQVYLQRGTAVRDDVRFRRRLAAYFNVLDSKIECSFASRLQREVGVSLDSTSWGYLWEPFWTSGKLRDVLDAITEIYHEAMTKNRHYAEEWLRSVKRLMQEESLAYRVDDQGGIHYAVDEEFEHNRLATLAGLGRPRYEAARAAYETAHLSFNSSPPDTRGAIRHSFDALETVFKLILGDRVSRLGAAEIERQLRPVVLARYTNAARNSTGLLLKSFAEWVNAAHQYRHAQGTEQPNPPPIELAILSVGSAASFLRWLIDLDQKELTTATE